MRVNPRANPNHTGVKHSGVNHSSVNHSGFDSSHRSSFRGTQHAMWNNPVGVSYAVNDENFAITALRIPAPVAH